MRSLRKLTVLTGAMTLLSAAALSFADEKDQDRYGKGESATPYSMKVSLIRADGCEGGCAGVGAAAAGKPAGPCTELFVARVESGRVGGALGVVGGLSLENVRWALIGTSTEKSAQGGVRFDSIAYYIDSGAKTEQKDALRRIFASPPFAALGKVESVTEAPITFTRGEKDLDSWSAKIGDFGMVTVEPRGGSDGEAMTVKNPTYVFPVKYVVVGKSSGEFNDHGKKIAMKPGCGEVATIGIEGEIPAMVVPAGSKSDEK